MNANFHENDANIIVQEVRVSLSLRLRIKSAGDRWKFHERKCLWQRCKYQVIIQEKLRMRSEAQPDSQWGWESSLDWVSRRWCSINYNHDYIYGSLTCFSFSCCSTSLISFTRSSCWNSGKSGGFMHGRARCKGEYSTSCLHFPSRLHVENVWLLREQWHEDSRWR